MKLKCIGGPNDGEWHVVSEFRMHDIVRILKPFSVKVKISEYDSDITKAVDVLYTQYRMDMAGYRTDGSETHEFKYLRWEELSRDTIMIKLLTRAFL